MVGWRRRLIISPTAPNPLPGDISICTFKHDWPPFGLVAGVAIDTLQPNS